MQIHHEKLGEIDRYIERYGNEALDSRIPDYERLLRYIGKGRPIDAKTKILEIGAGTAWFPMLCMANGLQCIGMDISPQLIETALELGRRNGLVPEIILGNIEVDDLGFERYDVIVASSVFEHVENWRPALENVFRALKPGGALFLESPNKFSFNFRTSEFPGFPFYSWLPNAVRYKLRQIIHGKDVMKLGIDFHEFTYPGLRKAFHEVGFRKALDVIDLLDMGGRSGLKRSLLAAAKSSAPVRHVLETFFVDAVTYVCVK